VRAMQSLVSTSTDTASILPPGTAFPKGRGRISRRFSR
jgi:hypothetical protein